MSAWASRYPASPGARPSASSSPGIWPGPHRPGRKGSRAGGLLFVLDEPTTGLHFDDIATLVRIFRRLLDQGHSLLVIEHNVDLIRAADWVIDLGPEGGDGGGQVLCTGTPAQVADHAGSHTGRALRDLAANLVRAMESAGSYRPDTAPVPPAVIDIRHAREHNLQDLSLTIPHGQLTVVTGVSGSGKSSLAFDVLFNEGQRRFLESMNAYARQFVQPAARADVDAIFGIPPTVAIEQRTSRGGFKSTVGTLAEIHPYLRLLYVRLGTQYCPDCDLPIRPQEPDAILDQILRGFAGRRVALLAPLVVGRKGIYPELAQWARSLGFATLRVDGAPTPTDPWPLLDRYREHDIDLPVGDLRVSPETEAELRGLLRVALGHGKGQVRVAEIRDGGWGQDATYSTRRACPGCGRGFPEPDPRLFSYNSKHGWCPSCLGTGARLPGFDPEQSGEEERWLADPAGSEPLPCPSCRGLRLRREALAVRFHDRSIADLSALTLDQADGGPDRAGPGPAGGRGGRGPAGGGRQPARLPAPGGAGLSDPGPRRPYPVRRRGPAHPPGRPARLQSARRLLCPGRAQHRPAPAGQRPAPGYPFGPASQGQHPGGGGA